MRKLARVLVLIVMLALYLIVSETTMALDKNLLLNPGIEMANPSSPDKPGNWRWWKSVGDEYIADFEWSDCIARSGKRSLRIGAVSKGGSAIWQSDSVKVVPGMAYRASVYVKVQGARVGEVITLAINWRDSFNNRIGSIETIIITEGYMDWTLVTVEGIAPENCAQAGVQDRKSVV